MRRAALAVVLVAVLCVMSGAAQAADRYEPLAMRVMSTPHWFTDASGRRRLVYELALTNGFPVPVSLASVTVRGSAGRPLKRLSGPGLEAAMTLMSTPTTPTTEVPASAIGVVWFDVVLPRRGPVPRTISHRIAVRIPPGLPVPRVIASTGGRARVDTRPPVTLAPPLRGAGWIAVGSCCDGPHRRSIQPINGRLQLGQRFAIDWNGMDAQQRWVVGNPDLNQSWVYFDKPVIAVADARVVEAVDRWPNQIPNNPKPVGLRQADGNHVILALGHGRFAFYAHLKPGSVRVKPGDRVRTGQEIGRLGNSGSSTGPHLHFHVMDRPSALDANGLPFVIDRFRLVGKIPPLDEQLAATIGAGEPTPVDRTGAGPRRDELPVGRDVVDFAGR